MSRLDRLAVTVSRTGIAPVVIGAVIAIALAAAQVPDATIAWQLTVLLGFIVLHGDNIERQQDTQAISATLKAVYPQQPPNPAECPHSWARDKEGPICRICHARGMIAEDGSRHYAVLSP